MKIIELNNDSFNKEEILNLLSKKTCLIGVFSKLCIHCQNMKSQWEFLKKKLKKSKCNGLLLEIDSNQLNYVDYSSLTNSVKGLPSIMVFKKGKLLKEYKGNRSSNDMFKFFKPYMVLVNGEKIKNKKTKKAKKNHKNKTRNNRY
jgi:thioredoxin-like negative regulator of GroEL